MKVALFTFLFLSLFLVQINAQTNVFAQLSGGTPTISTAGWNLTGNAMVTDTQGDTDTFQDEIRLTNSSNTQSGGIFYATPINPLICSKWTVEFDYRIWGGNAADGLAFCFLDVPPTGFVSGGGLGIPGSANGLKVALDTWDNGCGTNPELQIYYGVGYNECAAGIVKLNNTGGNLNFIRGNTYKRVRIIYNNGVITLFINNTQYLTANFTINFTGYMGFTASTGGANDQHSIKNIIIYTEQAVANAGSDAIVCHGETASIGSNPNSTYQYSWSPSTGLSSTTIANPTSTIQNTGATPITQTYTVTTTLLASPGVCPSTDQVVVTINPTFTTNLTQTICNGGSYQFGNQTLTTSGTYTNNLQSVNGCDSIVNLDLIISSPPLIPNLDTSFCNGGTAFLNPGIGATYSWVSQQYPNLPNGAITISPNQTITLTLNAVNQFGCTSSGTVTVTVFPNPIVNLLANSLVLCEGENLTLTASGADTYSWQGLGLHNSSTATQSIFPTSTQSYEVFGSTVNGCIDSAEVQVVVNLKPILTITDNQEICAGESVVISVSGADTYNWTPVGSGTTFVFTPSQTSNYQVVGTSLNGCKDSAQTTVIVHPNPIANVSATPLFLTSDSPFVTFQNSSLGQSVSIWNFGDGTILENNSGSIEYTYPFSEGNYLVNLTVSNEFGCSDFTTISIQIKGDVIFYIPNSFTPDGDEYNNMFTPIFTSGFDPANFKMDIYNRWGELIFETFDARKGWDGYLDFKKCPIGTYSYSIMYKLPETDEYRLVNGHVNLVR